MFPKTRTDARPADDPNPQQRQREEVEEGNTRKLSVPREGDPYLPWQHGKGVAATESPKSQARHAPKHRPGEHGTGTGF